jgi:glycosyltransferase involved in cell wall biosynthesis
MRRILIFSLAYVPFVGGAEIAVKEITDRLDPSEYQFDMITLRFDRNLPAVEKVGSVTVHRIGFSVPGARVSDRSMPFVCKLAKVFFPLTAFFKALSLHRKNRYDLVWALMANQAAFAALFFSASSKFRRTSKRAAYFLELQDGRALTDMKARQPILRLIWPLYQSVYLRADRIKAVSHFIEREVRGIGYAKSVEVIPNAVDVAKFSAPIPEETLAALKAKLDKRMGDIFLFTASRLVLSRGVEDIIRALPHLPLEVKLLVAGDGEDKEKLAQIAREEKVEGRVEFLGHIGHGELPAYLKASDIFVRPSIIEGLGNAFLEAFAAGLPVVATPVGGIPDFLTDGVTGVFCKVHDPRSVAAAVQRYLADPALVAKVVTNAKQLVAEKYEWDMIATAMKERIFEPLTRRG